MASHADRETTCMPELITLRNEHARLLTEIATIRAAIAAAQASERERCAKVCGDIAAKLALRAATAADGEWACVFGYQEVAVEECEAAIRALSPTPNQEKPE